MVMDYLFSPISKIVVFFGITISTGCWTSCDSQEVKTEPGQGRRLGRGQVQPRLAQEHGVEEVSLWTCIGFTNITYKYNQNKYIIND